MENRTIGVIGLGNMGLNMASTLIRKGFTVFGTDLSDRQKQAASQVGVEVVADIESLCANADTILLSLPMAKHVQSVITGKGGIIENAKANTLIIDTSTSEPDITKSLNSELLSHGHQLLDCPVSGGPAGALAGTMVMVVGGAEAALERAMPYLDALTAKVVHLGESGSGHTAKLINNLLCAAHLVTTAEAVVLGQKAGLDPDKLIEGLNAGSGRSAISEVNFPKWILNQAFDSGFTMQLMRKDVRLASQLVEQLGLDLPLSDKVATLWAQSEQNIANEDDFNCIVKNSDQGEP